MAESNRKKTYELKKIGKHFLIGTADTKFKRLTVLTNAKQVELSDNFLVVDDDTIYEIKEDKPGEVILVKIDDVPVHENQPTKEDFVENVNTQKEVTFKNEDGDVLFPVSHESDNLSVKSDTDDKTEHENTKPISSFESFEDELIAFSEENKQSKPNEGKTSFPLPIYYENQNSDEKENKVPVGGATYSDSLKSSFASVANDEGKKDDNKSDQSTSEDCNKSVHDVKGFNVAENNACELENKSDHNLTPYCPSKAGTQKSDIENDKYADVDKLDSLCSKPDQFLSVEEISEEIADDETSTADELEMGQTEENYESLEAGQTEETSLIETVVLKDGKGSSQETPSWSENSEMQFKFGGFKELPVTTMKNTISANVPEFDRSESVSLPQTFYQTEERPKPEGLFHPSNGGKYVEKYTINKIIVYVYKADILKLSVDCIVNSANKNLSHGGGVAYVIAKAAGKSLTREGDQYIAENTMLPVGHACTTTAGKLHYKCVVHTVGPYWFDYSPHTEANVRQCEDDLYHAIYSCFMEAKKRNLKTIAIPAVSSGIFGVPVEVCVNQYARATMDYCKKTAIDPDALSEIHFIDMELDIVKKLQDIFNIMVREGRKSSYNRNDYVKQTAYRRQVRQKSQKQSTETGALKYPEPLTHEDGWRCNVFCFLPNNEVTICMGDIFKEKTSGIVVSVNKEGQGGAVGEVLFNKMPAEYSRIVKSNLKKVIKYSSAIGAVVVSEGYSCGFLKILFVVYPIEAQRKARTQKRTDLMHAYGNVLKTANRDTKIHSVATTLFGIDSRVDEELKLGAEAFLSSYLSYCEQMALDTPGLKVKIMCKTEHIHDVVCSVFNSYVQSQKIECRDREAGEKDK